MKNDCVLMVRDPPVERRGKNGLDRYFVDGPEDSRTEVVKLTKVSYVCVSDSVKGLMNINYEISNVYSTESG